MFIRFAFDVWKALKEESQATGKSIPKVVQDIVAKHYGIKLQSNK